MPVSRGLYQASEYADAVVYVHYVVARLDLVQLLEAERHAAAAGAVGFQRVVVEAVEYLMVGEETAFRPAVDEALMKRRLYGSEDDVVAAVLEYLLQAVGLTRRVAQHHYAVSLGQEVGE